MSTTRHHTSGIPPASTPARTPSSTPARRWGLLVTVAIGLLLITLDSSILFTALPTLSDQLGATASQSLWIINAYPVVMAGLLLGSGALGDRVGHRRMFLTGLIVFGMASGAAAAATTPTALIAARAALAVGAAAMMPASLALIRVTFEDERERNLAVAVWGSIAVVGAALGPVLGGLLLTQFWWGSVFLVNVPVVVLALGATAALAPVTPPDPKARWDAPSSALALIGLTSLVVSIKEVASPDRSWALTAVALGLSALAAWRFFSRQTRLSHPLLDTAVFRNPRFSAGVIAAAFALFTIVGVQLVSTQRFQLVEGLTPLQSGLLVACLALGTLPTAMLSGALGHRIGELPLISGGLLLAALGVISVVLLQPAGLTWTALGLGLIGAGLGSVMALASATIINNVPAERAGMASSLEEVSYEMGSLSAVAVLGSVLAASMAAAGGSTSGLTASEGVLAGSTSALLITAGVVAAGAVLTAWLLRRGHPRPTTAAGSGNDGSHAREPA